jgi:Fe-S-cluster containining protein
MPEDIQTGAERRHQLILKAHPELLDIPEQAHRILNDNVRFTIKSTRLYRLADEMKSILEPFVVCGPGCSHCCHLPTMIYQHEADAMAVAANRVARRLKFRLMPVALRAAHAFIGRPCPFLIGGHCSIYNHRPLICRLHNSLNDNPEDCLIVNGASSRAIHAIDPDFVEMPYFHAVMSWKPTEPWGAINEFFPLDGEPYLG